MSYFRSKDVFWDNQLKAGAGCHKRRACGLTDLPRYESEGAGHGAGPLLLIVAALIGERLATYRAGTNLYLMVMSTRVPDAPSVI